MTALVAPRVRRTPLTRDSVLPVVTDGADWQAQPRRIGHDFRRLALAPVRGAADRGPAAGEPAGPAPARHAAPLEQILGLLSAAGFAPDRALHAYRSHFGLLHGHVLDELQEVLVDRQETDVLLDILLGGLRAHPATPG